MFCKKCGNALPDGAAFCQKCGTKVNENSVPTYIAPARAKASFPLKYIVIPVVILAVAAIAIVSMVRYKIPCVPTSNANIRQEIRLFQLLIVRSHFHCPLYLAEDFFFSKR